MEAQAHSEEKNSKMNLSKDCRIINPEFYQWQIIRKTQTEANCKLIVIKKSFITFAECNYLDQKHSIFGELVGGHDVLKTLNNIKSNK